MPSNVKVASLWTRLRMTYLKGYSTRTLVGGALTALTLVFIIANLLPSKTPKIHVMYKNEPPERVEVPVSKAEAFIERTMKDTRTQFCLENHPENEAEILKTPVTIILHFREKEFYDVVYTVTSIVKHTKPEYLRELLVLDDGSLDVFVQEDAVKYFKSVEEKYHIRIMHFASDNSEGPAAVRMKAAKVATGDILVFLDSTVVVNQGWLEPLVAHLLSNPSSIAVPHFDNILQPMRFFQMPESYGCIFGWSLNTYWYDTFQDPQKPFATAVMRGNAFAVTQKFLMNVGSFDEGLGAHGGENLELSIRAWLCGGKVEVVPCSRVAVRDAMKPLHIGKHANVQRIAELWFEKFKSHVYRFTGVNSVSDETADNAIRVRSSFISKKVECKSMEWYLTGVVADLPIPDKTSKLLGKLRTTSGHCAKATEKQHLELKPCLLHMFDRDMIFEMLDNGQIQIDDMCLQGNEYAKELYLRDCDENSRSQRWDLSSAGLLRMRDTSYCVDYARKKMSEAPELLIQKCDVGVTHTWTFIVV